MALDWPLSSSPAAMLVSCCITRRWVWWVCKAWFLGGLHYPRRGSCRPLTSGFFSQDTKGPGESASATGVVLESAPHQRRNVHRGARLQGAPSREPTGDSWFRLRPSSLGEESMWDTAGVRWEDSVSSVNEGVEALWGNGQLALGSLPAPASLQGDYRNSSPFNLVTTNSYTTSSPHMVFSPLPWIMAVTA